MRQTYSDDASTNSTYFQMLYIDVTIEDLLTKIDIVVASVRERQRNQQNTKYRSKIRGTKKHDTEKEKARKKNMIQKKKKQEKQGKEPMKVAKEQKTRYCKKKIEGN